MNSVAWRNQQSIFKSKFITAHRRGRASKEQEQRGRMQAPTVWGWGVPMHKLHAPFPWSSGLGRELGRERCSFPRKSSIWWSRKSKCVLVHSPVFLSVCFCTVIRPPGRPRVRLPSLAFQADCGSVKDTGVPTEEGTERLSSLVVITQQISSLPITSEH